MASTHPFTPMQLAPGNHQPSGHTTLLCVGCSDRRFLASASPYNSSVMIWDRVLGVGTSLARWNGPGIHLVKWSPNGHYLFAATTYARCLFAHVLAE
jgi:WD40 repeat protein